MSEQKDKEGQQKKINKVKQQEDGACGSQPEESNQEEEGSIKDEALERMLDDCLAVFGTRIKNRGREIETAIAEPFGKSPSEIYKTIKDTRELIDQYAAVASIVKQFNDERERVEKERTTLTMKEKDSMCEEKLKEVLEYYKYLTIDQNRKLDEKLHEIRKLEQLCFADRVVDDLIECYGIRVSTRKPCKVDDVFQLVRAVAGISMIYRDQWREFFYTVKKRMFQRENFLAYCCMVPVENYGPYFYSVLQRIAVIFEMAFFCFEHKYNYFDIAVNCIAHYFDVEFFVDAGDWTRLEKAADIVFTLTVPLRHALDCEKEGLESFSDVIKELLAIHVMKKSDPLHLLFQELNEVFEYKSTKKLSLQGTSCQKRDSARRQNISEDLSDAISKRDGREILENYLKKCLPDYFSETPDKSGLNPKTGEEYILDLESWIFHETTHKNKQEEAEVQKIISELNLESESKKSKSKGKRSPHKASPSGLQVESPEAETGARPKRSQKTKSKDFKYIGIQTDHVEELVELYQNTFSSFLKTYLHEYFIPQIEGNSCLFNIEDSCFIMPTDLMQERKKIGIQKTRSQKRLWGESPLGFTCAMPIEIERMLNMYIMKGHYRIFNVGQGQTLSFIGPDDKERAWLIRSTLDKAVNPFTAGSKSMRKHNDLLRNLTDDTHNVIGADLETARRLRMAEETVNVVLPTSETVESESPRRRKNKTKKKSKR